MIHVFYIKDIKLLEDGGGKLIIYKKSEDLINWKGGYDSKLEYSFLIGVGGVVQIIDNSPKPTLYLKNFHTLADEVNKVGTDYARLNTKKNAFFLGGNSYYVHPSLQGLNFSELTKVATEIKMCEISNSKGEDWAPCIYKNKVLTSYGDIRDLVLDYTEFSLVEKPVKKEEPKKEKIQDKPKKTPANNLSPKKETEDNTSYKKSKEEKSWWWNIVFYISMALFVTMCLYMCTHLDTYERGTRDTLHMPYNSHP